MDQVDSFQEFLATQSANIPVLDFVINLILAAILAFILGFIYIRYGHSISNRSAFARNFLLISMTTMLIISVVKSSLALSLGLVGALSIVRFRTAIKEPEELAYLFLAIAIGLGLGADQTAITVIAVVIIIVIIWLMRRLRQGDDGQNLFLTVSSHNPNQVELDDIVHTLNLHCEAVSLKRFDDTKELLEALFLVEFEDFPQLQDARKALAQLGDGISITFLEVKGVGGS